MAKVIAASRNVSAENPLRKFVLDATQIKKNGKTYTIFAVCYDRAHCLARTSDPKEKHIKLHRTEVLELLNPSSSELTDTQMREEARLAKIFQRAAATICRHRMPPSLIGGSPARTKAVFQR